MVLELTWHVSCHVSFSCPWMSEYIIISYLTLVSSNYIRGFDSIQETYVNESPQNLISSNK